MKNMIVLILMLCLVGCQANTEPIERASNTIVKEVIQPAVAKAVGELSTRTAQLQGQGSLINPGYNIEGFANFGPGVAYRFNIRVDGVSANIAGATQADAGQAGVVPPPAIRKPETQPE